MTEVKAGLDAGHAREVERWRARRIERLVAPDGWLSLVGLAWLEPGENAVILPGTSASAPARVGSIHVDADGGRVRFSAAPGVAVTHDGEPVSDLELRSDRPGPPTILRVGTLSFHVIERDGDLAVRMKDSENPARRAFRGIESYPVDARWRLEGRFEPYDPPKRMVVPDALDRGQQEVIPGAVAFDVGGATYWIDVFDEEGTEDLFLVFGDLTNRDETFGGGRYLYAPPPGADGRVVVDFNRAYNPPCVFTPFATCSLPPPQNRLPIRIEAGEKRYAGGKER